jgi:hypothetical protein
MPLITLETRGCCPRATPESAAKVEETEDLAALTEAYFLCFTI